MQLSCQLCCHRVGVDVIRSSELVGCHRQHHRDEAAFDERTEHHRIHQRKLAEEPQVVRLGARLGGDELAAHAGEADGHGAWIEEEGDEGPVDLIGAILVDLFDERGHDLHGVVVDDAEAIVEEGLGLEPVVDLRPDAVNDDGAEAEAGEHGEVVDHRLFHDDGLAPVLLDEMERLQEGVGSGLSRFGDCWNGGAFARARVRWRESEVSEGFGFGFVDGREQLKRIAPLGCGGGGSDSHHCFCYGSQHRIYLGGFGGCDSQHSARYRMR